MSTCYICTIHRQPSPYPESVMCCSTCGIFACIGDGARVHATGASTCAICMVRVLVDSATRIGPAGEGGGGGGVAAAEAEVRTFLSTEDFEHECTLLASISRTYRDGWRGLLLQAQFPTETAAEFGQRAAQLAGGAPGLAEQVAVGILDQTADRGLLADAAGVGEHAHRLTYVGPQTLPSVAQAAAERDAAELAEQELAERIAAESAPPTEVVGAKPQQQEEATEKLKAKYVGQ
jgi:hypothetical protein